MNAPELDKGGGYLIEARHGSSQVMLLPQFSKLTFLKQECLNHADDFDKLSMWSSRKQSYSKVQQMKLLPELTPFPVM